MPIVSSTDDICGTLRLRAFPPFKPRQLPVTTYSQGLSDLGRRADWVQSEAEERVASPQSRCHPFRVRPPLAPCVFEQYEYHGH